MSTVFTPTRTRISTERYQKMVATGVLTKYDRVELIEGDMLNMSSIGTRHSAITARLNELLVFALSRSATVVVGGPVNLGEFSEPQPDLMLLKRRADFYGGKIPEAADVLLLIEVSDSSLSFDQSVKLNLYARYGVAEYWVVDVEGKRVVTCGEPTAKGYAKKLEFEGADTVTPQAFPDIKLAVQDVFG
ncbi:MAG TPA: Uma2 family endonuclease [Steroidobacteraceae bacterium]|nr:Uma2 family endonuclease [Steroidobacteraceae bacterium]